MTSMIDDIFSRTWHEILARPSGPMALRFYMQPLMASLLAVRDGLRDTRTGQAPYFWTICFEPARRRELIRSGWQSIAKVFCIAIALDLVYQLVVLKGLRPLQTMLVAVALAVVPYVLLRGPVSRLARAMRRRTTAAAVH
jgi:hypothetical protein